MNKGPKQTFKMYFCTFGIIPCLSKPHKIWYSPAVTWGTVGQEKRGGRWEKGGRERKGEGEGRHKGREKGVEEKREREKGEKGEGEKVEKERRKR